MAHIEITRDADGALKVERFNGSNSQHIVYCTGANEQYRQELETNFALAHVDLRDEIDPEPPESLAERDAWSGGFADNH